MTCKMCGGYRETLRIDELTGGAIVEQCRACVKQPSLCSKERAKDALEFVRQLAIQKRIELNNQKKGV